MMKESYPLRCGQFGGAMSNHAVKPFTQTYLMSPCSMNKERS
jgi:hypothetical protein